MLNRIGAVTVPATSITVGTFALSGVVQLRNKSNLRTNKVDIPLVSDRFNVSLPATSGFSQPQSWE